MRQLHRRAPFLFFNGNTFADIECQIVAAVFAELPTSRRREVMSAVAHYIAGVLPRESMVEIVESLCAAADLKPGDRVKTLRGSTHGVIRWRDPANRNPRTGWRRRPGRSTHPHGCNEIR